MPTISIITPAYNAADHIGRTIASVQAQTFDDWEHIIVDDGSADDTCGVVAARGDARTRYVYQSNRGPAAARNHGIELARGEFLIFLDAGDWWTDDCLAVLLEGIRQEGGGYAIAHGDWALVDLLGNTGHVHSSRFARGEGPATLLMYNPFCIHAALVSKAHVVEMGGFSDTGAVEDWDLWLRVALAGGRFIHVPRLVALYHWQPNSRSKFIDRRGSIQLLDAVWATIDPDDPLQSLRGRSYATAHIDMCVSRFGRGDAARALADFDAAVSSYPPILGEIDPYYRIAYAEQSPYEDAGDVLSERLDEDAARERIEQVLRHVSGRHSLAETRAARRAAWAALGLANYHERRHDLARVHLWSAVRADPSSLLDRNVGGTLIRAMLPVRLVDGLRTRRRSAGGAK